jgi:hypothetical protein
MDFEVDRTDFRRTRVVDDPPPALADGQIRLGVERFAFTANNISYALSGDMLGYWDFFPSEAPWGRLPVMGLSTVTESANADIETGGRYFGFSSMSDEVVVDARPTRHGFRDVGAHRAEHAPVYTEFESVDEDPGFREDHVDEYLLLRGMFMTSFLVDDYLEDNGYGASQTLVTSASSKTSIALAHCLAARDQAGVGITSARNLAFVEGLGLYDSVVTYDDIETLDATTPSVVVDMAGAADVTGRIHRHFGAALGYSCQVGATHWEEVGGPASDLPGPTPEFFFAPGQMQKRNQDWEPGELAARIAEAFGAFLDEAPRWLSVQRSAGPDAVASIYLETLEGNASADTGHILSLSPNAFDDRPEGGA